MAHDMNKKDDMDMSEDSTMSQQERDKIQQAMKDNEDKGIADKKAM